MYIITKNGSWGNAFHLVLFEDINHIIEFLNKAYSLTNEEGIKKREINIIFDEDHVINVDVHDTRTDLYEETRTDTWRIISIPTYSDTQLSTIDEEYKVSNIIDTFQTFYKH